MRRNDLMPEDEKILQAMERYVILKLWLPAIAVLIGLWIQLCLNLIPYLHPCFGCQNHDKDMK